MTSDELAKRLAKAIVAADRKNGYADRTDQGRACLAEIEAMGRVIVPDWRSFDTTPHDDGVPILLWIGKGGDGYPVIASWFAGGNMWEGWRDDGNPCDQRLYPPADTLWMPIRRPSK